ncbi:ParA family protein [Jannaschia sp. LMIT008]|uniref:ParA family protein n=1 Tax=Jannaschia maritima TaxID=3032585 RepID=UPI002810B7CA|nr:ParA family protein [Jannaschia sp. LMIT008]
MQTIIVASQKGGAGKTNLVRTLSVAATGDGMRVVVVDLDPQGSLRAWWDARESDAPALVEAPVEALGKTLKGLASDFDLAVIDTPPSAGDWLTKAFRAADLLVIPVKPGPDDLRAVGSTISAATAAKVPFAFVVSMAKPRSRMLEATIRALAAHGRVAPAQLNDRAAYLDAAVDGSGVTEGSDVKARDEAAALWHYVKGLLDG